MLMAMAIAEEENLSLRRAARQKEVELKGPFCVRPTGLSWEFPNNAGKGKFAGGEGSDYYEVRGKEGRAMSIFRRCRRQDISEPSSRLVGPTEQTTLNSD